MVVLHYLNPRQHLGPDFVPDLAIGHWPVGAQRDHHEDVVGLESSRLQVVKDRRQQQVGRRFARDVVDED